MSGSGGREGDGAPALGRGVEGLDGARLSERVGGAEARRRLTAGRGREVRELAGVGGGGLHLDLLDGAVAAHLDDGGAALPRVVEEQGALVAHGLELVARGD